MNTKGAEDALGCLTPSSSVWKTSIPKPEGLKAAHISKSFRQRLCGVQKAGVEEAEEQQRVSLGWLTSGWHRHKAHHHLIPPDFSFQRQHS